MPSWAVYQITFLLSKTSAKSIHLRFSHDMTRLTCVTMIFSGLLSGVSEFSVVTFPFSTSSLFSRSFVVVFPSCTECERIAPMHSSTWKCKKLFHVYAKNKSWNNVKKSKISVQGRPDQPFPHKLICNWDQQKTLSNIPGYEAYGTFSHSTHPSNEMHTFVSAP